MNLKRNNQIIKMRCDILESLGFKCLHEDNVVIHPHHEGLEIDFSAVNMDVNDIISYTISRIFEQGYVTGREHLQGDLRGLLGVKL